MKVRLNRFFLLLFIAPLFFTACIEDPDNPTDERAKFLGTWTCTEANRKLPAYAVEIAEDPLVMENVTLQNFGLLGDNAKPHAEVSGDYLTVPSQFTLDNSWEVEGDGVMVTTNSIDWSYELNDGSTLYQITAQYTK